MWKVFLVEDERVIREGFRDKIPWEQYGFQFAGEACDGEMALPMIRKMKPDVLITDIKMPFMDGLSLSEIVKAELPKTKIIIISGYDDFDYARQAISIGVDQYLLKPITRMALRDVLLELREKFEKETEQSDYQVKYSEEVREYEQFSLRRFFEKVLSGTMPVREIYEKAAELSLDLNASCYNLILFTIPEDASVDRELFLRRQEEIFHYFLRSPRFVLFRLNVNGYGLLVKAEPDQMEAIIDGAVHHFGAVLEEGAVQLNWYAAIGEPVERISMLPDCFRGVNHCFAYRFMRPELHVLSTKTLADQMENCAEQNIDNVDLMRMDPEIIKEFLTNGEEREIHDFVESYLHGIVNPLKSMMFRSYVVLNIRFAVTAYLDSIGAEPASYQAQIEEALRIVREDANEVFTYFVQVLGTAMAVRDQINDSKGSGILSKALRYIDENYSSSDFSLGDVSEKIDVSSNYLSAIFSQNMKKTFIEYVTEKRVEQAKKLLRRTDKSTSEIAHEVGYKDPHYFSFVFKKILGVSPREYRAEKNS